LAWDCRSGDSINFSAKGADAFVFIEIGSCDVTASPDAPAGIVRTVAATLRPALRSFLRRLPGPLWPSRQTRRSRSLAEMAAPSSSEGDKILDLEREIDALRQAVDARDQFIATAGHELRNPMLPIVLATQRLIAMAERSQGNAAALLPDLRRLERLVDLYVGRTTLLLDISRITAGHQKLEPESLDLAELLRDIVASYADAARRAGSTVATDIPDTVPGRWDRLALRQVIENLVSNAIKYGDGKPIAVALEPRGETVRIVVKDNGIGIKEEDQARIFDRFERAVSRRRHGGFGIGLWLANELVTAMAGRITIESAAGDGSSFTVTLPVHHDKDRVTT